jgi:hypothetical protein
MFQFFFVQIFSGFSLLGTQHLWGYFFYVIHLFFILLGHMPRYSFSSCHDTLRSD